MKLCNKCGEVKPRSEFHKNKSKKDGLRSNCKLCAVAYQAKRYQAKKEEIAAYQVAYRKANPKKVAARDAAYRKANPEKRNATKAKRRAAKLEATPPWLTQHHLDQIEGFYRQAALMKRLGLGEYHVDHIVPLQGAEARGLHVPWNLQVLPASQNLAKSNKLAA